MLGSFCGYSRVLDMTMPCGPNCCGVGVACPSGQTGRARPVSVRPCRRVRPGRGPRHAPPPPECGASARACSIAV
eukprot:5137337-Prymnesium_polylepis.1